jgi:hypothetical protein
MAIPSGPRTLPLIALRFLPRILAVLLYEIRLEVADLLYFGPTYEVKMAIFSARSGFVYCVASLGAP